MRRPLHTGRELVARCALYWFGVLAWFAVVSNLAARKWLSLPVAAVAFPVVCAFRRRHARRAATLVLLVIALVGTGGGVTAQDTV
jgi:hypothetical protein